MRLFYLRGFVVFLGLSALIAVISVLIGNISAIWFKVLVSALSIAAASLCALSCTAFSEQRQRRWLSRFGIGVIGLSLLLFNLGLWLEIAWSSFWNAVLVLITVTFAAAHGFWLQLPQLEPSQRWLQRTAGYAIAVLALLICATVIGQSSMFSISGYWQLLTISAVAAVVFSAFIPVQLRININSSRAKFARLTLESLILEPLGDGMYRDASGQRYIVERLELDSSQ